MTEPKTTDRQALIQAKLGDDMPLAEYVRLHRADGDSWQQIMMAIWVDTGVVVTDETLRGWFG